MDTLLALAGAAGLTIVVETLFLYAVGYRSWLFVEVCILINLATNLTLNLGMSFAGDWYWYLLFPAEAGVVVVEWAVLKLVVDERRYHTGLRLFVMVFLANLITCSAGLVIFLLRSGR